MKQLQLILFVLLLSAFSACSNSDSSTPSSIPEPQNPLEALRPVDDLLGDLAGPSQTFNAPADKPSELVGEKGTRIHVDPDALETMDGSPLGKEITVELRELTATSDLVANRASTVSNGRLLETGGAYFIDMNSGGKPLRIKEGQAIEVEFPRLSEKEMGLFFGQSDPLGAMNWVAAEDKFVAKKKKKVAKPAKIETWSSPGHHGSVDTASSSSDIEDLKALFSEYQPSDSKLGNDSVGAVDEKELARRNREAQKNSGKSKIEQANARNEASRVARMKANKAAAEQREINQSYEAIRLVRLGWINCDRIVDDSAERISIPLAGNNDLLLRARVFAAFTDIRSVLEANYDNPNITQDRMIDLNEKGLYRVFEGIPEGIKFTVIAISNNNNKPQFFEKEVMAKKNQAVKVKFSPSSKSEIENRLLKLN